MSGLLATPGGWRCALPSLLRAWWVGSNGTSCSVSPRRAIHVSTTQSLVRRSASLKAWPVVRSRCFPNAGTSRFGVRGLLAGPFETGMFQEERPTDGLERVLQGDPLLRTGASPMGTARQTASPAFSPPGTTSWVSTPHSRSNTPAPATMPPATPLRQYCPPVRAAGPPVSRSAWY